MPFFHKRKENCHKRYSTEVMKAAVKKVADEGFSIRGTALDYNIDRKTLEKYVKKYKLCQNKEDMNMQPNYKTGQIFTDEEEKLLAEYLILSSKLHYGLTSKTTRQFVYQFAIANNKKIPHKWIQGKIASYDWLRGFMHRHEMLSLRKPESTSLSRSTAFNKFTVGEFQENLKKVLQEFKFGPESIYNMDETGITTVHKPEKIICSKGEKQVSKVTSGERGSLVTLCATVCAIGTSVPPFMVFPRVRVKDYMAKGAPIGTAIVAHPSGWMTWENFNMYLNHFIKYSKCNKDNPVLLILDNHDSHISPTGLQICKDNGIVLLTLPPHTSHRLQPLDRTVFGPFKTYYNESADDFMVSNPGKPITIYDIATLVGKAYPRAFNPVNIVKGFASTGIYPFNTAVFSDVDYLGANVTDRQDPATNLSPKITVGDYSSDTTIAGPSGVLAPCCSSSNIPEKLFFTPEQVRPFPKAGLRKSRGGRRRAKSRILTHTPIKRAIEIEHEKRKKQKENKILKKNHPKIPNMKKKIVPSSTEESDIDISTSCMDEDQEEFEKESIRFNIGDFVVVKFTSKKNLCYFVGQVTQELIDDEYQVSFLRRCEHSYTFIYPENEDSSVVYLTDMIKLPCPMSSGGTERVAMKVQFDFDFSQFMPLR